MLQENDSNQNSSTCEKKFGDKLPAVGSAPVLGATNGHKHSNGYESPRMGRRFVAFMLNLDYVTANTTTTTSVYYSSLFSPNSGVSVSAIDENHIRIPSLTDFI